MWAERNERGIEGDPPCEDCRVDLLPENDDAQRIFYIIRYQLIMGPGGPVDIIHSAVRDAIKDCNIRKPLECFEKVCMLARRWWIPKLNERSEAE
jgi:hypothetical protein